MSYDHQMATQQAKHSTQFNTGLQTVNSIIHSSTKCQITSKLRISDVLCYTLS